MVLCCESLAKVVGESSNWKIFRFSTSLYPPSGNAHYTLKPQMASLTRSNSSRQDAPPTQSLSHSNSSHNVNNQLQTQQKPQQSQSQPQGNQQPQQEDPVFGPLERAGKVLDERLSRDERWTGIGDSLGGML